jgi:hypothetical protein
MPTLRLIYLTEHQYQAFVTAEDEKNDTNAELPTAPRILHQQSSFPIDDATRNASSNNTPSAAGGVKMEEQSDHHEEGDDYADTLLQEAIDEVNTRSFVSHDAVRDQHVSSDEEESENESSLFGFVDKVQQFQHEMVSSDEESENESEDSSSLEFVDAGVQQIAGEKRRASIASKEMVAAVGTRRSKRAKVAPAYYVPAEEESLEAWSYASSGVVIGNNALTAAPRPLDHSSATDETTMNVSNEDTNIGSSRRVSAVAAASTMVHKRRKAQQTFDERFKDLKAFKAEFGHCNVPSTRSNNNKHSSLGKWCLDMRQSYKTIKKGGKPRSKLSEADMKRLEKAGFEWILCKVFTFDDRFKHLMSFKAEYGHCNVPYTKSYNNKHLSLGVWCINIRQSYKAIKEGGIPRNKLSKANIQRLENAEFQWNTISKTFTFDKRFKDLMAFKAEFGHCNVPCIKSNNNKPSSLGKWCSGMRQSYKTIKQGGISRRKLSQANIQRLENAGFEWNIFKTCTFDERFKDLMAFKAEFDHCKVPCTKSSKHCSLGLWCSDMRQSYKTIKEGGTPRTKLSEANIKRLEKAGFKWRLR